MRAVFVSVFTILFCFTSGFPEVSCLPGGKSPSAGGGGCAVFVSVFTILFGHSAAVSPISISRSALCVKSWLDVLPVRETHAFLANKVDVDVATLRPFRQFLYPGPPCASKVGLILSQYMKSMYF